MCKDIIFNSNELTTKTVNVIELMVYMFVLTAVKSAPKNPCSTPDQIVSGIISS